MPKSLDALFVGTRVEVWLPLCEGGRAEHYSDVE
jgi:hypothetical protein